MSAYIFGGKSDARRLPITKGFETEVVGETADSLRSIVSEHKGWLSSNCQRQVDSYRCALSASVPIVGVAGVA